MSSDSRRAALLLHAMDEADRQWALARLSPASRATVDSLLDELRTLGIPADESLVREALNETTAPVQGKAEPSDPIASSGPDAMLGLLRYESPKTIAWVLSLQDWPWRESVLARLPSPLRDDVLLACVPDVPPALAASIRSALRGRLADTAGDNVMPAAMASEANTRRRFLPAFRLRGRS